MIAYFLSVHKNPEQVSRLMQSIYNLDDLYYINIFGADSINKRIEWTSQLKLFEKDNVHLSFKYSNSWGTIGLVNATIDAMKYFSDFNYSYFVNLSGQCYPIKPETSIKKLLSNNNCSYITYNKMPDYSEYEKNKNLYCPPNTKFHFRFRYHYYKIPKWLVQFPLKVLELIGRGGRTDKNYFVKIPRMNKKLLYSLELYYGSQWFCLTRNHVEYILKYLNDNPDYLKFFSNVLIPDEHFFQMILLNSPLKTQIINDNLRFIIWPGPKILKTEDANIILSSEKLFARKFDTDVDSKILDMIDGSVQLNQKIICGMSDA